MKNKSYGGRGATVEVGLGVLVEEVVGGGEEVVVRVVVGVEVVVGVVEVVVVVEVVDVVLGVAAGAT